jgi:hypothetical protein
MQGTVNHKRGEEASEQTHWHSILILTLWLGSNNLNIVEIVFVTIRR